MENNNFKFYSALILIFILAFSRIIPHPPNFTPILGMAVFAGATFDRKIFSFLIPLIAMALSDLFLGFHSSIIIVYLAICVNVLIGVYLINISYFKIIGALTLGSITFFIITNFSVWALSGMYAYSLEGLFTCYTMALPFFQNTIFSTILYGLGAFIIFDLSNKYLVFRPNNY
tara:strand:+ start:2013 stop:2531 length:519 start_codon:yes stop_codon:yes gene_type:complete